MSIDRYRAAERMLAEISTMDDADAVMRLAEAARVFAERQRLGIGMVNHATAIKIKAGLKLVELHDAQPKPLGGRGKTRPQGGQVSRQRLGEMRQVQKVAPTFANVDERVAAATARGRSVSVKEIVREAKELDREEKREHNRDLVATTPITQAITPASRFPTIVIDPPWDWGDEGDVDQMGRATPTYGTMPIADIAALSIAEMAEPNAHLYLWITNRSLPKGFALLEGWGFRYVTCLTWCKPSIGMGNYYRGSTEQVLFGVRGSLPLLRSDVGTWFAAPRAGAHSSKPGEFYALVESASPGPWVDVFGRTRRAGWSVLGAEAA